jgi:serine/threonine-protein kinase
VDRNGKVEPLSASARVYHLPRLSPDGERIASEIVDGTNGSDIWIHDIQRGAFTRLTFTGNMRYPSWTADGKRVAFNSRGRETGEAPRMHWKAADGSSEAEPLIGVEFGSGSQPFLPSFSLDGRLLAFHVGDPKTSNDIWVQPLSGDGEAQPFIQTPANELAAAFSPDGKWLAWVSNESGGPEVYVTDYPDKRGRWQVSTDGGTAPLWARDGKELFYRDGDRLMVVEIAGEGALTLSKPMLLFEAPFATWGWLTNYDISPDGQRFLMIQPSEQASREIHVVLNWDEELKRLAPVE